MAVPQRGLLFSLIFTALILLHIGNCLQMDQQLCRPECIASPSPDKSYQRGVRYTYRYSSTITTTLQGSTSGRNGLALDCVVDIDVISKCHLMMQIRNPQIKRLSPQKEHSVQRLKSLRESLERSRLKFSLQGGKVTALCPQEGEQLWTLNIKRALLSMLQTSRTTEKQEVVKETDLYGTCTSKYERRGPLLVKTRNLRQCQQDRLAYFWPNSTPLREDTTVDSKLQCTQRHGTTVMEEVNCTEIISMVPLSGSTGVVKTQTVSTLTLLRAQKGTPSGVDTLGPGVLSDLQFVEEGAEGQDRGWTSSPQEATDTVRKLCGLTSDQQQLSELFLHLAFQLRALSLPQLRTLWHDASFKCRNDWQPLLDGLPACGSEECIALLTDLIWDEEIEQERAHSFLTTIALIPHPSPHIVGSVNALLKTPEVWTKALLTGSSLVHLLCRRSQSPCSLIPQVQSFIQALKDTLGEGCGGDKTELLYALKAVGNAGLAASALIPQLNLCIQSHSTPLELRLTALQAFRRIPCSADRGSVLRLYRDHQEEVEVRIAAYQQIMHCPDPEVLRAVKTTLSHETSSQVGSFVWSHLTQVLRTEDPMKQALMEALPDDIITKDFEAEPWKYSSYSDYTADSGFGVVNMEGALVFSSKSFVPRYAMANLTVYIHGRAFNLLEVDLRVENIEPLLKHIFGHKSTSPDEEPTTREEEEDGLKSPRKERRRRKAGEGNKGQIKERRRRKAGERDSSGCSPSNYGYLSQARAMFSGGRLEEARPRCWLGVKVFGNELSVVTCADLYSQIKELSLSMAGLAVRLLKGQEVQLHHRAVLMTEELVLPSLSGLPIRLGINMTSLLSLHLKGSANYRDWSHFSLAGHIKPNAYVGLSARMGVDGGLGRAGVEWATELRTTSSLDGSVHLQEGHGLRVALNTPEDLMDIVSLSSRMYHVNGDHREEMRGSKSRVERTTCTPKTWSKMVGWQLCSNVSYPLSSTGLTFLPPGPMHLSLRLLKLDRGLHQYLLEAAYSLLTQSGSWLPREASLHLLLATPQSSIPRDMSLDLALSPHRLLLKMTHPLKTLTIQGQLDQVRNMWTGQLELLIDNVHQYYIMGLIDSQTLLSEQRLRYHLEAKVGPESLPMILSANVTRGLGRKTSLSATLKNVFREAASFSVVLERRLDDGRRQYSVEAELLLPGMVGSRILGLMEQKGPLWSSALRLKYGLREDSRHLRQECHTSQSLRSEREPNQTYRMRAEHEFYCSTTAHVNHKVQLRHEESPSHTKSSVDVSYGKHWDEINNKHRLLLSQSFRNQSRHNLTSYALEFSLQVPDKRLNYKTQLMHSHLRQRGAESSTHLKVNYNDQMPLVAGLHWKDTSKAMFRNWEGMFNMDTPWLYMHTTHKLSQPQRHTYQLTSELTARKWLTVRSLVLEGYYRDRSKDREARLHLYAPAVTYLKAVGWVMVAKQGLKASCTISSVWSPALRGDLSLENSKQGRTLQLASSYGKHNLSLTAGLTTLDKNLRKRMVMMKMTLSEPKRPSMELELEGGVEELRKDKQIYQKRALLLLRQPFQNFLQSFLLQETFTVDLHKGLYILESKAHLYSNREIIHTLTLGYQQPSPFVCSSLTHPFSYDVIPPDSEVCVTMFNNQTQREVRGSVRIGKKDRLTFLGQIQLNPSNLPQHRVKVRANLTHLFQLKLPSSAILEGDVSWDPNNNSVFDYLVRGKVGINRQECQFSVHLNGSSDRIGLYSSLTHPFQSKILKTLEARLTAYTSMVDGRVSSSLCVRADGKDRALLEAQLSHSLQRDTRALSLHLTLLQTLLPTTATQLHLNMSANMSSDRLSMHGAYDQGGEVLQAQVAGSLEHSPGSPWLRMAVNGGLRHSLPSLTALPPALSLEGALGQSDWLTEGQLRVTVSKAVYSVELSHQQDQGDTWEEEDGMLGKEPDAASDWLCARAGEESLCVNVSRRLGSQARGGVNGQLSHSSRWLHTAGIPGNSSAQVSWTQEEGRLSVLAKLQTGAHGLKAEFERARTGGASPRWELQTRVQHQSKALVQRGLPSSIQATGHYQEETERLSAGLAIAVDEQKKVDVLVEAGKGNTAANLTVSLLHHLRQLKGMIPTSLQMSCTGYATNGAANDRLSAQCSGSVAGRPVEVRAFRSERPHSSRLCYGLALAYPSITAQAKGCYSPMGQAELRANLTHSSRLLQLSLGLPSHSSLRLLLRPGPKRWGLGFGSVVGPWRMDLSGGLRQEAAGLYSWHGLVEYGTPHVTHKAEVRGRVRAERWCYLWVEVSGVCDSVRSSLVVSTQCGVEVRVAWVRITEGEGALAPSRTSMTIIGSAVKDGLRGTVDLENNEDSLHCLLSLLLRESKAELGWTLHHQWATLSASSIPESVDLHGSAQLRRASLSGNARVSLDTHSANLDVTATWEPLGQSPNAALRVVLQHDLATLKHAGIPEDAILSVFAGPTQAQVELESDTCSMLTHGTSLHRGEHRRTWTLVVRQRCNLLKTLLPPYFSVNGSLVRSGCTMRLDTHLHTGGEERGAASLALSSCLPQLSLRSSIRHSLAGLHALGLPPRSALVLGISTGERPGVGVELELGQCRIRADSGENKANWVVNVTHYCPELQSTGLPASLAFQGLLSLVPCQLAVHCTLKMDNHDLNLELGQSCSPAAHLSGSLTHSFPGLRTRGLPLKTSIDAWAPEGPGQTGALLIKAGSCHIRANGDMGSNGRTQWATESDCPLLQGLDLPSQVHLNGSVGTDDHNIWVAILDASVEGQQRGSLRLTAGARSGLRLEGHLIHNLTALEEIPGQSRIVVTGSGRADSQGYDTEVELQLGECAVRGSATVMTRDNLKGAVVYHNNCTALQEWGSPVKMNVSWSLVITQTLLDTHVSMAMDEKKLQALMALKTTKGWQEASAHLNHSVPLLERVGLPANSAITTRSESHGNGSYHWLLHCIVGGQQCIEEMTVERSQGMVRVKSIVNHTMELLKNWGLPENNSIQLEIGFGQVRNLTIQSQFGAQLAGLGLQLKDSPLATELRGNLWHSWLWLQERGFPQTMEALCSTHRVLSQLRSRAHLSVDGHRLLGSGLNISLPDGHLAMLLSLTPPSSPRTDLPYSLDTALTAQFTGPMRSVSVDLHCKGRRVRVVGDVRGWRTYGGSREARATIQHSLQGQTSPILQVEAWGRLTDSQLRCSVAVNPELSSSVALIIQGHHLPDSKELMVKVVQNIPQLLLYLPTQLNARSQLNQSDSSVRGMVELQSGKRKLWALGELAVTEGGYRQALELNQTYPQLKPLPRNIAVRMSYEARNWSHQLQHWAVWGSQEFNMAALYSAPPGLQQGDRTLKVQIASVRHGCSLDVALERSLHGRLDSVVLGWSRHGRQEEVRALSLWRGQGESSETTLELRQPFTLTLSQLYLHTISRASATEQRSNHQTHVSWDSGSPVNVSLTLSQQWLDSFSRGQACARFSPAQEVVPSLVAVEGCVSMSKEGNSYSQNAELKWGDKSLRQSMNYQWSATGLHTLQLEAGAENVSPAPCPSHTLLAQFHTNLRDRMEHHIQVGLCPPHLSLGWSGYHRVNIGKELLYTKTRLSLAGQPHCSLTLALTNSSTAHSTNISLVTESKVGNWSVKVGGSALSSLLGPGLQIQVRLDRSEQVWLRGALEGRCLHATVGYGNGIGPDQDLTVALCLEGRRKLGLTLEVLRREDGTLLESLTSVSVGTANQSLWLRARGCAESLLAVEAQVHHLSSQMRRKILERVQTLQHLLTEFRQQSKDIELLQELSGSALRFTQRTEALLGQREGGAWGSWRASRLRHALTHSLPRLLLLLQHASQLGQHELRRPLSTIAGAYHDVTGQKVDSVWREAVSMWTDRLVELLPPLLENPHLRPVAQFTLTTLSTILDVVSHQTGHWAELRLAVALAGVRRRLASVYKLSASDCSVSVTIPLPLARAPWSRMEKFGVVEVLLEEWLLRPLQALTSLRPTAELYRLKRKITDSPFCHEALLVANQFVVSFDGHLYELPGPCPVILAHDITQDDSFTVLIGSDSSSQHTLLVRMNNSTVAIHHNGEVKFNCHVTQTSYSDNGLVIRKEGNVVEVSNQNGVRVSCDPSLDLCSLTLDGWLHGVSTGVLGTNDNEAGNDFPLPDGSQADNMADFMHSWQISPECGSVPQIAEPCSKTTADTLSCDFLFSARDSPLGSCFRVVDPGQFLSVCERSHCGSVSGHSGASCKLAAAFVYLCQRNYVPLELPVQCIRV